MSVTLKVNGVDHPVDVSPDTPLLWAIRDHVQLTGTKFGCGLAQCGACTVHVDGQPTRSCVTPVSAVEGKAISARHAGRRRSRRVAGAGRRNHCQPGRGSR
ncbi:2Fe-2S iron-sulfur cluster-binding protein [Marinobacterium nitratireducens]|uniref:2Fe-2S iron-sulfur cluster-binding protein n=1 Tax=Marinobacterium nitratireducens TaxID=518897 RepID=UPI001666F014